jgi:hypothetical protein
MGIEERGEQLPVELAATKADKPEPYDPEHLKDVVTTFIEGKGGKVFIREMIYALTLRQKIPKDLYQDTRRELRNSGIVKVSRGRYILAEQSAPKEQ